MHPTCILINNGNDHKEQESPNEPKNQDFA